MPGENIYPLPVYHFNVVIGDKQMRFQEVSGLSIERQLITYKDGLSASDGNTYMPGQKGDPKLTLKRGVTEMGSELYQWMSEINITKVDKKEITISLLDEAGEVPVVTWTVKGAFPLKLDAPGFNAATNDVAVESLELAADDITVKYENG